MASVASIRKLEYVEAAVSPRLKELVSSADAARLAKMGLTSVVVIANMYDTEDEAITDLAPKAICEPASLWQKCSAICDGEVDVVLRSGIKAVLPVGDYSQQLFYTSPTASTPLEAIEMALASAPVKDLSIHSKLDSTVKELWDLLVSLGDCSALVCEAKQLSLDMQRDFRDHLISQWVDLPLASLRCYVATFKHYAGWCDHRGLQPWRASRTQLALYFAFLQQGRATVAKGRHRALSWLNKQFEIGMSLESKMVVGAAAVRSTHVEQQVSPMRLSLWALLDRLCFSCNMVVRGIALFWIGVIQAVLRPIHLQRARILPELPESVEGVTQLGKSRVRGKRRPFSWRMPRVGISGTDIGGQMLDFFGQSGNQGRNFFLPDISPHDAGLQAKAWTDLPMQQSKIRNLTDKILATLGVPPTVAAQLRGFYSGRRLLPTLAHRARMKVGERLDVGGWSDQSSSKLSMPQRYSEARLDEQLAVRAELLGMASTALAAIIERQPSPTLKEEVGLTISQTWKLWPKRGDSVRHPPGKSVLTWLSSMFPLIGDMIVPHCKDLPPSASVSMDASSSSSSSSESCMAEPPGSDVNWELAGGRNGHLHLVISDPCACGRKLNRPEME